MKTKKSHSKPSSIPNARWATYATAAAATALAGPQSAEATIHYSGHLRVVFKGATYPKGSFRSSNWTNLVTLLQ